MGETEDIRQLVQDAVNQGASTVEEVHKRIAAMPLAALKRFGPLRGAAETHEENVGTVYDTIRMVNDQVGIIAKDILKNAPGGADRSQDLPPAGQ